MLHAQPDTIVVIGRPDDGQLLAIGQNQLVTNHGLASRDGQLLLTKLILENLAFVTTYLKCYKRISNIEHCQTDS